MSSAHKKVIVRRFTGDTPSPDTFPYPPSFAIKPSISSTSTVASSLFLSTTLSTSATSRDFNLTDTANPERLTRRTFLAKPRTEGLWLRMTFRTGDLLEGLAPIDIAIADDLLHDAGFHLTPPDVRSNTQRIYVPRTSITDLQLIAVITSPSRRKTAPRRFSPQPAGRPLRQPHPPKHPPQLACSISRPLEAVHLQSTPCNRARNP